MSEPETDVQSSSRIAELEETCGELRRVVNLLFAGLVITSFTLTAYLGLEGKRAAQEAADSKRQADQLHQLVQQGDTSLNITFAKLEEFGRTHPDFQSRILSKYRITTNAPDSGAKK